MHRESNQNGRNYDDAFNSNNQMKKNNPATRNRTRDHLISAEVYSQMLYQLSYSRHASTRATLEDHGTNTGGQQPLEMGPCISRAHTSTLLPSGAQAVIKVDDTCGI